MADAPAPDFDLPPEQPWRRPFYWLGSLRRSRDALFLLNSDRRILFVNKAWQELTGIPMEEARGLYCRGRAFAEPGTAEAVTQALSPPPEILTGRAGRARRQMAGGAAGRQWWDVDFFPFHDGRNRLRILGRITLAAIDLEPAPAPLPQELAALRQTVAQRYTLDQLASTLPALHRVAEQVRLAAQTRVPVLVLGAPGAGKQWIARTIHYQGPGRDRAFAALDCAHLPAAALAAALFADDGLVRRAGIGTLYLKEPSHLPRDLQVRLGDWLHTAGSEGDDRPAGPRLIVGCSIDPAAEVRAGRLLDDLHCTLTPLVISLPPLCERQADLPDLVERLLQRANALDEHRVVGLTPEAWKLVRAYRWPGNLRELYEVLVNGRAKARGDRIDATDLPAFLRRAVSLAAESPPQPPQPLPLDQLLEQTERRLIELALKRAGGKHNRAAELLDIPYPRLWRRMKALGIVEGEEKP
jgi:transcriptional regulator with PAS, ATPase and Fis domain